MKRAAALLGLSMGAAAAVVAQGCEQEQAASVDRLILVSPGVWGWSPLPCSDRNSLSLGVLLAPGAHQSLPSSPATTDEIHSQASIPGGDE